MISVFHLFFVLIFLVLILAFIGCPCTDNSSATPPSGHTRDSRSSHSGKKCDNGMCNNYISWFCSPELAKQTTWSCGWCSRKFCMDCEGLLVYKCIECDGPICVDCSPEDYMECPGCTDVSIYFLYAKHLSIDLPEHILKLFDGDHQSESERLFDDELNNLI